MGRFDVAKSSQPRTPPHFAEMTAGSISDRIEALVALE
jgi:hypothetical protein